MLSILSLNNDRISKSKAFLTHLQNNSRVTPLLVDKHNGVFFLCIECSVAEIAENN